ncbi:uncharacterized protein LOC108670617 [Hyalella azteca]|uniref:Uncharacterized protein LOC108670617 n=1 Tax=Hyalella azteca TaxID=294128 RepID=A0A8B7NJT6_HYAAZ|nr:uncharacterized protein LOC108670617 [Hyalella azteca]
MRRRSQRLSSDKSRQKSSVHYVAYRRLSRPNMSSMLMLLTLLQAAAMPVVDPGVFVIQGVETCGEGEGYCMLGEDCSADVDFLPADPSQHCKGLKDGFTPTVSFSCCVFNEAGKALTEQPTTEMPSFTITDVTHFLQDEIPILEHQESNDIPEGADPANLIEIVGVITDMTGVLGLVTEPYKGTLPSLTTAAPSTTTTTTTPLPAAVVDELVVETNSSHASISLDNFLSQLQGTKDTSIVVTTEAEGSQKNSVLVHNGTNSTNSSSAINTEVNKTDLSMPMLTYSSGPAADIVAHLQLNSKPGA